MSASNRFSRLRLLPGRLLLCTLFLGALPPSRLSAAEPLQFNRDIRPILSDNCFLCHGPDEKHREAELRLDTRVGATRVGDGGPIIAPGKPDQSLLLQRILSEEEDERMPPVDSGKELSKTEIARLRQWIAEGADYQQHWSYVTPVRPQVPAVKDANWPTGDIDRFILARLEREGLRPSPAADSRPLARRLYLDLLGLPPSWSEAGILGESYSEQDYERLVDHLLQSEHYGERMAIYWLDLVRYANTVGYHGDQEHAIIPYRDYVIKAFNDNMPFDQFTREQIAGDLLPDATDDQKIASGYNRLLQTSHEGGVQVKEYLAKYSADRVRNLSNVWLGATMGCAECHNHKYDPYTQKDFYSLAAFFADVDDLQTFQGGNSVVTERKPEMVVVSPIDRARIEGLQAQVESLQQKLQPPPQGTCEELRKKIEGLQAQIAELQARRRRTMVTAAITPRTIRILPRGDWLDESGAVVKPEVPSFLPPLDLGERRATRLDLARWLTRADHPQTARVFVNRLWYLMFGAGLVDSLDDHGSQSSAPHHPQLLDYLAREFVDSGWNVKHLVKMLVMSRTYRQSSLVPESLRARDPRNSLLARQTRARLPAELIRDTALRVSGLLDDRIGGAESRPYQPEGYYRHLNFPTRTYRADTDENQYRRGVYVHWQRQFLHPMLLAFDAPSREECTAKRPVSNTPTAALTLLNDPTFVEAARGLAQRALREELPEEQRIAWIWREALSREPSSDELNLLGELLERSRAEYAKDPASAERLTQIGNLPKVGQTPVAELAAWTMAGRAILNLNELITRN